MKSGGRTLWIFDGKIYSDKFSAYLVIGNMKRPTYIPADLEANYHTVHKISLQDMMPVSWHISGDNVLVSELPLKPLKIKREKNYSLQPLLSILILMYVGIKMCLNISILGHVIMVEESSIIFYYRVGCMGNLLQKKLHDGEQKKDTRLTFFFL
jgi:hypothetical protein